MGQRERGLFISDLVMKFWSQAGMFSLGSTDQTTRMRERSGLTTSIEIPPCCKCTFNNILYSKTAVPVLKNAPHWQPEGEPAEGENGVSNRYEFQTD